MNQPTVSSLKVENRFSDCLLMKLHSTPAQAKESTDPFSPSPSSVSNLSKPDPIDLKVTIRFGQQEIKIKSFGRAEFSLAKIAQRAKNVLLHFKSLLCQAFSNLTG